MDWLLGQWEAVWVAREAWSAEWGPGTLNGSSEQKIFELRGEQLPVTVHEMKITITQVSEVLEEAKGLSEELHFERIWRIQGKGLSPKIGNRSEVPYLFIGQGTTDRIGIVVSCTKPPMSHNVKVVVLDTNMSDNTMAGTWTQSYVDSPKTSDGIVYGTTEWKKVS